jgi:hypothetical protein
VSRVAVQLELPGAAAVAEQLWYDLERWPAFVDGFARVVRVEGDWPRPGALLEWESTPAGRGRVIERVLEHAPGSGQALEVTDTRLRGTQRISFDPSERGVVVALELDYRLRSGGPLALPLDLLFVRSAIRDSLERTVRRFGHELGRPPE